MTQLARSTRTYGQFCPVAAGLDVVGDRWVLLILREMLVGRRRFSEIKRACPGIAPNLLSERLRTLVDRGLVDSDDNGYALTDAGQRIRPVIRAMAVFGTQYLDPDDPATPDASDSGALAMARAFLAPYQKADLPPLRVRVLAPNDTAIDLVKLPDLPAAQVAHPSGDPDVVFKAEPTDVLRARRDGRQINAEVTGDDDAVQAFLRGFQLVGLIR